jgi:hypothetical protein
LFLDETKMDELYLIILFLKFKCRIATTFNKWR